MYDRMRKIYTDVQLTNLPTVFTSISVRPMYLLIYLSLLCWKDSGQTLCFPNHSLVSLVIWCFVWVSDWASILQHFWKILFCELCSTVCLICKWRTVLGCLAVTCWPRLLFNIAAVCSESEGIIGCQDGLWYAEHIAVRGTAAFVW